MRVSAEIEKAARAYADTFQAGERLHREAFTNGIENDPDPGAIARAYDVQNEAEKLGNALAEMPARTPLDLARKVATLLSGPYLNPMHHALLCRDARALLANAEGAA